jgi:hypothetical protein
VKFVGGGWLYRLVTLSDSSDGSGEKEMRMRMRMIRVLAFGSNQPFERGDNSGDDEVEVVHSRSLNQQLVQEGNDSSLQASLE